MGSYAEEQIIPPSVDFRTAASVTLKGLLRSSQATLFLSMLLLVGLAHYYVNGQMPLVPLYDFVTRVGEITSGKGVSVVYDSVGKDTFQGSLACLTSRGHMVSFGQASGKPDPIPLSDLASKSLFLTRPNLMHYTTTRDELLESAEEVFANVASGVLRVRINHTLPIV